MSLIMEAIKKAQQRRGQVERDYSWPEGILGTKNSLKKRRGRWWILPAFLLGGILMIFLFWLNFFSSFSTISLWPGVGNIQNESSGPSARPISASPIKENPGAEKRAEKKLGREVKKQESPATSPAKAQEKKKGRPLLPLTLVAISEPQQGKEVFSREEILPPQVKEDQEIKGGPLEISTIAENKEGAEQKIEKVTQEERAKPSPSSAPDVPAPEIKVEKVNGEPKSVQEAIKNFNTGVNFYQQRDLAQAMQAYKKALQYDPHFLEAYNNLALIYQEIGDLNQARETLQRATEINPNYEKAWNNLGVVLLVQNRFNEAKEVFQKTLLINPHHVESYLHLGVIYRKEGELKKAAECYQKALQINPWRGEVHYNLAIIWEELNDLPQAISHYRSFLHLRGKDYPGLAAQVTRHLNRLGKEEKGR
ncbi:MAG: tetratricopeptide repeat protein [Thermodesulfobacteriota bacterium]